MTDIIAYIKKKKGTINYIDCVDHVYGHIYLYIYLYIYINRKIKPSRSDWRNIFLDRNANRSYIK